MKKVLGLLLFSLLASVASALPDCCVDIYVDAAPNVYGSSAYPAWQQSTFDDIYDGTFLNMRSGVNSANVGTTDFEIQDEVVYSFGDLGKRLTWVYYIEGATLDCLSSADLKISLTNTWDGVNSDFYYDYYGSTWITPTKLYDYDGDGDGTVDGVYGVAGMAWWGAYSTNTQEELDADIYEWMQASESWTFSVSLNSCVTSITCNREAIAVPAPGAVLLAGFGASLIRKFRSA